MKDREALDKLLDLVLELSKATNQALDHIYKRLDAHAQADIKILELIETLNKEVFKLATKDLPKK